MTDDERGEVRKILMTDGEELEATPAAVRMFRAATGWGPKRFAQACAEVAAAGSDGGFPVELLIGFERGEPLSAHHRAILEETLARHAWLSVVRGEVGIVLKRRAGNE